ncbi:MAG: transketolase, partial [Clostridia bacterium]|nr:transketolase [Clostridia bacterium]
LSADLSSSTKVKINDGEEYSATNRLGKNIAVGIREHAMGAIANGIALHGGLVPITSTFLVFSNYMLPSIRMAGIMNLPVIFTFSHSSAYDIADGITHVPVEQLDQLRLIPNITTFRPCDSAEIKSAYDWFYQNKKPMCLCVSKTATQPINSKEDMGGGAYFVTNEKASMNIMASGTDVELALQLQFELKKEKIIANVISMISLEVFENQSKQYKNKFLSKPLFVVETSTCAKYLKYTSEDKIFNISKFGISADSVNMQTYYGYDLKNLVNKIKKTLK